MITRSGLVKVLDFGLARRPPSLEPAESLERTLSVPLATASPGLTVTKDGKTVVIEGVSVITQDLMRIENFR